MNARHSLFLASVAAALMTLSFAPSPVWAYYVETEGSATVRGGNGPVLDQSEDTGPVTALSVSLPDIYLSSSDGDSVAWADVRAGASLGLARVHAEYYAYGAGGTSGSYGVADATARWADYVTTTSDTLPDGAEVTYRAQIELTGSLTEVINGNAIGNGIIRAVASGGNTYGSYYLHIEEKENDPGVRVLLETFTARVGNTFPISSYLYGYVGGDAIFGGSSHLTADFLTSAGFTLVCLTPGAEYTTESGVSYVPEPCATALLAVASVGLVRRRRNTYQLAKRRS